MNLKKNLKNFLPRISSLIMALLLIDCTQIPGADSLPSPAGTFLFDDNASCLETSNQGGQLANLGNGALAQGNGTIIGLVTTDATYSSSSVWGLNPKTEQLCLVVQGESGDTLISQAGKDVAMFSRRSPQLNFSVFTGYGRTVQRATPLAENGDPQVMRVLVGPGREHWLLAMNTAGKVVEVDPVDPERSTTLVPKQLNSDAAAGRQVFRPADLLVVKGWELGDQLLADSGGAANDEYILALHQGLDAFYRANGSQALYAWRRIEPGVFEEIDLNPRLPGVNGLPLRVSNPAGFIRSGDRLSMVGFCFSADGACRAGVETVQLSDLGDIHESRLIADYSAKAVFSNGYVVGGVPAVSSSEAANSAGFAFAAVRMTSGKKIVSIDLKNGNLTPVYSFADENTGFYGLAFDQDSSTLMIGDSDGSHSIVAIYGVDGAGKIGGKPAKFSLGSFGQPVPLQLTVFQ